MRESLRDATFTLVGDYKTDGSLLSLAADVNHYGSLEATSIGYRSKDVSVENAKGNAIGTEALECAVYNSEADHMGEASVESVFKGCRTDSLARDAVNADIRDCIAPHMAQKSENVSVRNSQALTIGDHSENLSVENSVAKNVARASRDSTAKQVIADVIGDSYEWRTTKNGRAVNTIANVYHHSNVEIEKNAPDTEIFERVSGALGTINSLEPLNGAEYPGYRPLPPAEYEDDIGVNKKMPRNREEPRFPYSHESLTMDRHYTMLPWCEKE